MINLIAKESITYITKLSNNEIINRLCENSGYEESGYGYDNDTFCIKRVIDYGNSFLPLIKGNISENSQGTIVKIRMKLPVFVIIFMTIWLGRALFGSIISLYTLVTNGFDKFLFAPFIMILFGILLPYGAFKFESNKSKKELQQIFEAEIVLK